MGSFFVVLLIVGLIVFWQVVSVGVAVLWGGLGVENFVGGGNCKFYDTNIEINIIYAII